MALLDRFEIATSDAPTSFGVSPEQRKARQQIAQAMLREGMSTAPVQHWTQGAARVAQALMGGYDMSQLDNEDRQQRQEAGQIYDQMLRGQSSRDRPGQMIANNAPETGVPATNPNPQQPSVMTRALMNPHTAHLAQTIVGADLGKAPSYGVIGEDQFGNKQYGWIDPRSRSVTPTQLPQGQQPAAASGDLVVPPAPPGADPKEWRKKYTEAAVPALSKLPATSDEAMKLRKEITDLPSYKNFAQSAPVFKSMGEAAARNNRAADVNLIYGMAKVMDPGSVVRESEMSVAQAIATLPQHLQATITSQLNSTGRLSPEVRQGIMEEAHSRVNAYRSMFENDANFYRGIATRNRFDHADVIPTFPTLPGYQPPAAAPPAADLSRLPEAKEGWVTRGNVRIRRKPEGEQ